MIFELYLVKEKKQKNTQKIREKKEATFIKKSELYQNPIEWPMNFSAGNKKKHNCIWMNEWMTNVRVRVKKNTVTLERRSKKLITIGYKSDSN